MNKNIAVVLALVVVFGAFFGESLFNKEGGVSLEESLRSPSPSLSLPVPIIRAPDFSSAGVETEAWGVFQDYLKSAKAHDLEKLSSLSYQLSPACSDPARQEECYNLMNSVYNIAQGFRQYDFSKVLYDDKQVALVTEYKKIGDREPLQMAIIFVRENDMLKVLSIQFCVESSSGEPCFLAENLKRDSDQDGLWDNVEDLFNR